MGSSSGRPETRLLILVVNFFSVGQTRDLVRDLGAQPRSQEWIVTIVDNSVDEVEFQSLLALRESSQESFRELIVVASPENRGYAGGNNFGYEAAADRDFDVVAVINPDVELVRGDVSQIAEAVAADPDSIWVPQRVEGTKTYDGRAAVSLWTGKSRQLRVGPARTRRRELIYPGGHFMVISRLLWEAARGFDERYFLYSEEVDLVLRLRIPKSCIRSMPELQVGHESGGATGSRGDAKSQVTLFHAARSSLLLFKTHPRLRAYLPSVVVARCSLAIRIGVAQGGGRQVLRGAFSGLRYRSGQRYWEIRRESAE